MPNLETLQVWYLQIYEALYFKKPKYQNQRDLVSRNAIRLNRNREKKYTNHKNLEERYMICRSIENKSTYIIVVKKSAVRKIKAEIGDGKLILSGWEKVTDFWE